MLNLSVDYSFDNYSGINGYYFIWDDKDIARIIKKNKVYYVTNLLLEENRISTFDSEIEALEYILEIIKVHVGE